MALFGCLGDRTDRNRSGERGPGPSRDAGPTVGHDVSVDARRRTNPEAGVEPPTDAGAEPPADPWALWAALAEGGCDPATEEALAEVLRGPLWSGGRALFVSEGPAVVAGTWNGWDANAPATAPLWTRRSERTGWSPPSSWATTTGA